MSLSPLFIHRMLMDIFGGNAKTMMFAAVSPALFNFAGMPFVHTRNHCPRKFFSKVTSPLLL